MQFIVLICISLLTALGPAISKAEMVSTAIPAPIILYVENNTGYPVHVGKTFYNKTSVDLTTKKVDPWVRTAIGKVTAITPFTINEPVSFYARVGDEQNYWNTPLIRYAINGDKKEVYLEPKCLLVNGEELLAEVHYYGTDNRSLKLQIDQGPCPIAMKKNQHWR